MGLWSRFRNTVRGNRHRAEIDEELQFHLDLEAADGHDRRQARLRLGNVPRIAEETRMVGILEWLDSALHDARYGARQLRRSPALMLAVVLSLTVGVGANTAIFSLVDAALLKPLPVRNPDQLVILEWTAPGFPPGVGNINGEFRVIAERGTEGRRQGSSVGANVYRRFAREQTAFDPLVGVGAYPEAVAISSETFPAEQVSAQYVSSNFFEGLGVVPVVGRSFREEEDRLGAEPVIVVSHRLWVSRLGRGLDVLGRTIRINSVPSRVVGVAPPGFFGVRAGQWPDVYAPLAAKVAFQPAPAGGAQPVEDDRNWWVRQIGRLKPGVSEAAALSQVNGPFRTLVTPEGSTVDPQTIPNLTTMPGGRGFDVLAPRDVNALCMLALLVAVLLLLVCANVANLLLSRAVCRQRESAVRLALGAARVRLFRQHLIESGVLALAGGAAGLALGYLLAQLIHSLFQTGRDASNAFDLHVDARMLGFTGALVIVTAFLFGLAPAVRAAGADLGEALKTHTRSVAGALPRLPRVLVSVQIALCLTALVASGLLVRSLENLKSMDVGFDREHLAYASVSPSRAGYSPERISAYVDRVREELGRLPGVLHVSPVQTRLLSGGGNFGSLNIPGHPYRQEIGAHLNGVGENFFETLGIRILAGRTLQRSDIRPANEPVVVDELFVRQFFPNENPLGRRFGIGPKENQRYEIVGVVANSRYNSLRNEAVPGFYLPYRPGGTVHFAIRTTADAPGLAEAVRNVVVAVDPAVPLAEFHTQAALIDRLLRTERLLGFLSVAFGAVALTLAAVGLGGLLMYLVARRTNEIGVRIALGATAHDVTRMVLRDSLRMVGAGFLIGLPCAYVVARILRTALFGLEPLDPAAMAFAVFALVAVALGAAWIPAFRAARIDPITALRQE
jgi:predicted permease